MNRGFVVKLDIGFRKGASTDEQELVKNVLRNSINVATIVIDGRIEDEVYIPSRYSENTAEGFMKAFRSMQDNKTEYGLDSVRMKLWTINPDYPDLNGEID